MRVEDSQCVTVYLVSAEITISGRMQDRGKYMLVCVKLFCFGGGHFPNDGDDDKIAITV